MGAFCHDATVYCKSYLKQLTDFNMSCFGPLLEKENQEELQTKLIQKDEPNEKHGIKIPSRKWPKFVGINGEKVKEKILSKKEYQTIKEPQTKFVHKDESNEKHEMKIPSKKWQEPLDMNEERAKEIFLKKNPRKWPEVVGMNGEEAKKKILLENPYLNVEIIPDLTIVDCKIDLNRVRVSVDLKGKVCYIPNLG
ncbi:uncharacterized protein LOC131857273 [Cryptomeria japonica]|uniref:uncharacterized protein LOC131857273 n=1 Tax=Cryptomeria japonica TaxID=3369 RepID=UPI0027DAAEC9|nr:uncharacterized protein LOC131857273 [Cryptomeria japonica]